MKNTPIRSTRVVPSSAKKEKEANDLLGIAATAGFSAVASVGSGIMFMLAASAVAIACPDPDSFTLPSALAAYFLGAFAGGFVASRREHRAAFAESLLAAALQSLAMLAASAFIPGQEEYSIWFKAGLHVALFGFYAIGAALGRPRSISYAKRAKRHRKA